MADQGCIKEAAKCPRCGSMDTKFSYYQNQNKSKPRYLCKNCQRCWTIGGRLRGGPISGDQGCMDKADQGCLDKADQGVSLGQVEGSTPSKATVKPEPSTTTNPKSSSQGDFPFIKSSFMRAQLDSIEVIKSMEPKPHFRPLQHLNEFQREGLATGLMLSFAEMVETVRGIQVDLPRSRFDEILKGLGEFKEHGFPVQRMHNLVTELLRIKDNVSELQRTAAQLEERIQAARALFNIKVAGLL